MSSSQNNTGWYQRTHQFAPYTRAEGEVVAFEFDAIQASFEKIPTMRDDGKGFSVNFIIPEPTDDQHPVTLGMFRIGERSVQQNTVLVVQKAQEVVKSAEEAEANAASALSSAQTASAGAQTAQSAAYLAQDSETMARKWAANPLNQAVRDGLYSAYHYAQKSAQSERAASSSATSAAHSQASASQSASTAGQKAAEAEHYAEQARNAAKGKVEWGDVLNPAQAGLNSAGITQLSSETDSTAEDKAATPKAIKVLKDLISAVTRSLSNYIPNSKKSNAVNSPSSDTVATSLAAKTAYDKGMEAKETADTAVTKSDALETKLHDVSHDLQDFVNLCLDPTLLNPKLGFTWRAGPTGGESIGGRTVRVISDRDNLYSRKIKVKAGERYYLSCQYLRKQGSAAIAIGLCLDWDKSSRRTLKPSDVIRTNLVGGVTKIECYVDIPEGYDEAQLWLQIDQYNTNATQYYIDNVEWRRVSGSVVSVLTGEIAHGGTIPLPAGFAQEQCKWHLSPSKVYDRGGGDINNFVFSADGNRLVTAHTEGGAHPSNRASYIIIGIK